MTDFLTDGRTITWGLLLVMALFVAWVWYIDRLDFWDGEP